MKRIPRNALARPLQGNARVLSYGGRRPRSLVQSFQAAHNRANRKNEQRYQQLLSGYDALHGRVMGDLANVGAQSRADIDRTYRNMGSDVYNRLVARGFGNSSLNATMQQGVQRERQQARNRLEEGLLRQRAGYDTGITQGKMGVIERRNDVGPDPNMLMRLAQMQGAGNSTGYGGTGGAFMMPPTINQGGFAAGYGNAMARHLGYATSMFGPQRSRQFMNMRRRGGYGTDERKENIARRMYRRPLRNHRVSRPEDLFSAPDGMARTYRARY